MKTSEVLRRVLLHLKDDGYGMAHHRYSCYAVNELYQRGVIGDRDRPRVKKKLLAHLNGAETLEEWLYAHHGIQYDDSSAYRRKIMATRKAWLAHLIEFYQRKAD